MSKALSDEEYRRLVDEAIDHLDAAAGLFYRIGQSRLGYWSILSEIDTARDLIESAERANQQSEQAD